MELTYPQEVIEEIKEAEELLVPPISTVRYSVPISLYWLNGTLKDNRPIPLSKEGKPIEPHFIKYYLSQRLKEYSALGGIKDWEDRKLWYRRYSNRKAAINFIAPFHWDLWKDLENLRKEYKNYQEALNIIKVWYHKLKFGEEEGEEDSIQSFITQILKF